MKSFPQRIETLAKIQLMEGIDIAADELFVKFETRVRRTHFYIFPSFAYSQHFNMGTECTELLSTFNEWLAMI